MTGRWWSAPAWVVLAALGLILAFLSLPLDGDGSYSCRGSAIGDVINPEPEDSAAFRAEFFDSGWACNHEARHRAEGGAVVLGLILLANTTWAVRRRRECSVFDK